MSEASIVGVALTPTHDGEAALVVELEFAGGARSKVQVDPDSISLVLARAGVGEVNGLVGLPWSVIDVRQLIFAGKRP